MFKSYDASAFVVFTRKQANVVYAAMKRGEVRMSRAQVKRLYDCVGTNDMQFSSACSFICEGRYDLAQAMLDGGRVEAYDVEHVTRTLVTEENAHEYLFFEVGDVVEETTTETRYRVVA